MKPATLNLACCWSLPRPIIKLHPEEKVEWPWARKPCQFFSFPYNISATAGASNFKFGVQLGFAKAHHKIIPMGKVGVALG